MDWPSGGQDLIVTAGQTYMLPPNDIPHFKSIIIQQGGTFVIGTTFFAANPWSIIGCSGDFILQGTLLVRGSPVFESKTYQAVAPDGTQLSRNFVQLDGGFGGSAYTTPTMPGSRGGPSQHGSGGGGGAPGGNGTAGSPAGGGGGASGNVTLPHNSWQIGGGGGGGNIATNENLPAGNGSSGISANGGGGTLGGGGGGGARGSHGGFLYLRVLGHIFAGEGSIDLSGAPGGNGGSGGNANNGPHHTIASGAGGGGGAGGNGGYALISFGKSFQRGFENVTGGNAGAGGVPGSVTQNGYGKPANAGASGQVGTPGLIDPVHQS